ncbi:MAG: D-alanine--D-alanine ligase [Candidatus Omnitrophica bacterium]|nr:D-alanine--D-alanine ligase [Candidatus Omnitrophota bacterium]
MVLVRGRIGVLMGGPSSEREISLLSGKAVFEALKAAGLDVVAIDITTDDADIDKLLISSKNIDCAFLALHGRFGEDGTIQKILEDMRLPYTGSGVLASQLAMDKVASHRLFQESGLSVPKYAVACKNTYSGERLDEAFSYPIVVKPVTGGSSIGLSIVDKKEDFIKAMDLAFTHDGRAMVDEYIKGRELTVGVLEEKALPVIEIIPKNEFFDFEAKYQSGLTEYVVPARLDSAIATKVREVGLIAHKLLGCSGCSRTDIILTPAGLPYILEVNTIPGMTATSLLPKAARNMGVDFTQLCLTLIRLAYEKTNVQVSG